MLEPRYATLKTLFADRVFRIPPYQRFYSWLEKQRRDLFEDLERLAERNDDQHHFMATLVCHKTQEKATIGASEYGVYDIVDGQQRLTTIILLLKLIESGLPADSPDRQDLSRLLVKSDGVHILLQTNNANATVFNAFLRQGTTPSSEQLKTASDRNLADAIQDCATFIDTWCKSKHLLRLLLLLLHRVGFVVYDTEDPSVVYTLFEVLNSRGLAVDWLDKAKTLLMGAAFTHSRSRTAADECIDELQKQWTELYRTLAQSGTTGQEVLRVSTTLYYGTGAGRPLSSEEALEKVRENCQTNEATLTISGQLLSVARKLNTLYSSRQLDAVTDILHARVLAVAIQLANGLNDEERNFLMQQWERVTFRIFVLFAKDARTKVGDYVRLAFDITQAKPECTTYNQIMRRLRDIGREYPIARAVDEGLRNKNIYAFSPDVCRYVLWNYEEHLARQAGVDATTDEQERSLIWRSRAIDSVEHIFPRNPQQGSAWSEQLRGHQEPQDTVDNCIGSIGNLVLLPKDLNATAGARSFQVKKEIYNRHRLRMLEELTAKENWTFDDIREREERISQWALNRWADI